MYIQNNLSDSLKNKRRKKSVFRFFFGLFLTLVIFSSICYMSHSSVFEVQEIKIFNHSSVAEDDIKRVIEEVISKNYFYFFSSKNFLFIPKSKIEREISKNFIKLDQVKVFLLSKNILAVETFEREIKAKWCDTEVSGPLTCFFLDRDGVLFAQIPEKFGNHIISFFGETEKGGSVGSQYIINKPFQEILDFCDLLTKLGLPITQFTTYDSYFEIYLRGGALVYISNEQNLQETLTNIESLIDSKTIEVTDVFLSKLKHLDLRYGNKIHFDFR